MLETIFKAYDVRGTYPDALDEQTARRVGYGAAQVLKEESGPGPIVVGRDMRKSSPSLHAALIEGIRAAGCDVGDLGMCDTSMVYFAINHLEACGGVQVTASHNPPSYNGFKVSGAKARPLGRDTGLDRIRQIAEEAEPGRPEGRLEELDLWEPYRAHVRSFCEDGGEGAAPLKLFIDGSNGMAGRMVPEVFEGLPGVSFTALNFEMTGEFAHEPNPLKAENLAPTQEGVRGQGADLGVCFDGDADRCMLVDEKGETMGCDHLTALFAAHFLEREPGAAVAYDLRSSRIVRETIERLGGEPYRSRVGHVFMKKAMYDADAPVGGELSGHFYFRGNYYADSGAIALAVMLSILRKHGGTASEAIAPYRCYPQTGEINFRVEDKDAVQQQLKQRYNGRAQIDELDGVTVDAWEREDWWFNVRPSNTEPLLRFNAEARDRDGLDRLVQEVEPMLGHREED